MEKARSRRPTSPCRCRRCASALHTAQCLMPISVCMCLCCFVSSALCIVHSCYPSLLFITALLYWLSVRSNSRHCCHMRRMCAEGPQRNERSRPLRRRRGRRSRRQAIVRCLLFGGDATAATVEWRESERVVSVGLQLGTAPANEPMHQSRGLPTTQCPLVPLPFCVSCVLLLLSIDNCNVCWFSDHCRSRHYYACAAQALETPDDIGRDSYAEADGAYYTACDAAIAAQNAKEKEKAGKVARSPPSKK